MSVQYCLILALNYGMIISITMLFENRSSLITRNKFKIKKVSNRLLWIMVNFFGCMALMAPIFLNLPDQMEAKMAILKILPCPNIEFFTEPILVLAEGFWSTYTIIVCTLTYIVLIFQVLFFTSCCVYYLFISKTSQVSLQTRRIQVRRFYGIFFQTFIPILLILAPLMILMNRRRDGYDQLENNIMMFTLCSQSGATCLSILLVHTPYRNFIKSIIWKQRESGTPITHVTGDLSLRV